MSAPDGALGSDLLGALRRHKTDIAASMENDALERLELARENADTLRRHLSPSGRGWCWLRSPRSGKSHAFLREGHRPTDLELEALRELGYYFATDPVEFPTVKVDNSEGAA